MQVQNPPPTTPPRPPLIERLPAQLYVLIFNTVHDIQTANTLGHAFADELERRDLILKPFLASAAYAVGRAQSLISIRNRVSEPQPSQPPAETTARGPRVGDPQGIKNAEVT